MDNINFKKVLDDGELFDQQANYEETSPKKSINWWSQRSLTWTNKYKVEARVSTL